MSVLRRAVTALVSCALALSLVAAGTADAAAPPSSPAGHGATWLDHQLRNGLIHNSQYDFDDYGLTADTAFALTAIGGHRSAVRDIRHALAAHVDDYTTYQTDRYAGATAKLLVLAQQTGADPRHFGGVNLVRRLTGLVSTTAPTKGRIEDKSASDYANVIGQVLAVRGLLQAHNATAGSALHFLLEQQCASGYFRLNFTTDKSAANQRCTSGSPADTDVTAFAVVQLWKLRTGHPALAKALTAADTWLRRHQRANGSFGGGPSTSASNANSTGLAGWALGTSGQCRPAREAATWVSKRQVRGDLSGSPLAHERGAIAYDAGALKTAQQDGITKVTRDQWRRATAQAAPSLLFLSGCRAR